jgi:two-component system invasion response regulator UvrY
MTRHVLIADDHEVTRRGLRAIVDDAFADAETSEASDLASIVELLPTRAWALILLDVMMPGSNVLDVLARIRASHPAVPVLVLTGSTEIEHVIQTLRAGANGFVQKHRASDELLAAIRQVESGGHYLDAENAVAVASALGKERPSLPHDKLSERELQILRLIAVGRSVKEIAVDLGLSDKTVATYLARIYDKTGLSSHVEIARYALQNHLVD